ncbi:hypothetical protein DPV79_06615 [Burkholderia reimsis]|uniref:Zinc-ribbon domain-containing protein n=1 Tax=Burkholderia reimsis TaxID=2234132 RepID=A0A365QZ92_9BURK|nr:hypothetical protein [Burkholderia reimsis]RBB41297.1 hypothetical protein DPV79_06615 [Burkholderia reimsis]
MTDSKHHPSLEKLKLYVETFGWRCLSDTWAGYHTRYVFECGRGHRFERHATPLLYRAGKQPVCAECEDEAIRESWLAKVAGQGGELVRGTFTGLLEYYRLRCAEGHEWETQGRKISEGSWCPSCAHEASARRNLLSDGLKRLRAAARAHGGRCLATAYTGARSYYPVECVKGHRWEAEGGEILRGTWCLRCARSASQTDANGLTRLQAAAQSHGGVCLSTEYVGQAGKYRFRCREGHEWMVTGQLVLQGRWCRRCAADRRRLSIEEMRETAAQRGGACLSDTYVGKEHKLTWQCHRGHIWQARAGSVRQGSWCPSCAILDRIRAKNNWKRSRYEGAGKLDD